MSVQAVARVLVTVEVRLIQPWGEKASLGEIYKTAAREGVENLRRVLSESSEFRIVGEPSVTGVLTEGKP